jgi:hypothetical protein
VKCTITHNVITHACIALPESSRRACVWTVHRGSSVHRPGPLTAEGLPPASLQIVAGRHRDDQVLLMASRIEAAVGEMEWPDLSALTGNETANSGDHGGGGRHSQRSAL